MRCSDIRQLDTKLLEPCLELFGALPFTVALAGEFIALVASSSRSCDEFIAAPRPVRLRACPAP